MMVLSDFSKEVFYTLVLSMPRFMGAMAAMSFLGPDTFGGKLGRNGVAAALSLVVYPIVSEQLGSVRLRHLEFGGLAVKEYLLGMLIGSVVMVVFWGIQAVGEFIDNQRGATMASMFNPALGEQVSPLSLFMAHSLIAVFFCTGLFLAFISGMYMSFEVWPAISFWPTVNGHVVDFLIVQFALISKLAVLVGGPVVIAMFFCELGLGFIGRFAPQLNVFFLSMPIKSAVALLVLILFWTAMIAYFGNLLGDIDVVGLLDLLYG